MQPILRLHKSIHRSPQSLLAGLLVLSLLGSAGVIPVTQRVPKTSGGEAFPCQGHACGCHSAASCLDGCCCFSREEIAEWRQRQACLRNETCPTAIVTETRPSVAQTEKGCCAHGPKEGPRALAGDLAGDLAGEPSVAQAIEGPEEATEELAWISIDARRRCQGVSPYWLILSQALPADTSPLWQFDWSVAGHVESYSEHGVDMLIRPAVPPPRA